MKRKINESVFLLIRPLIFFCCWFRHIEIESTPSAAIKVQRKYLINAIWLWEYFGHHTSFHSFLWLWWYFCLRKSSKEPNKRNQKKCWWQQLPNVWLIKLVAASYSTRTSKYKWNVAARNWKHVEMNDDRHTLDNKLSLRRLGKPFHDVHVGVN